VIVARLVAVDPIQHDGKLIAPGESFDVPDEAAAALLACGAATSSAAAQAGGAAEAPAPQAAPEPARRRSRSAEG
jgi:hypothetical protein